MTAPDAEEAATPASSDFTGTISTPMRDRLLSAVAAASPCSKGKMPMQLPPPPPGMPASQVEKWRKEVAKIVSKQVRMLARLNAPRAHGLPAARARAASSKKSRARRCADRMFRAMVRSKRKR